MSPASPLGWEGRGGRRGGGQVIARMSTVLTGPGGTESEWIRMRGEGTVLVFHGKLLDDSCPGGETERVQQEWPIHDREAPLRNCPSHAL